MTSISPNLSTVTHSTAVTTATTSTTSKTTTTSFTSPTSFNYAELFNDVDWSEVNLIDIEREWRDELEQIEKVQFAH